MGILETLLTAWPVQRWRDVTVLVAVSGGADSIALLRALTELRTAGEGRLVVAHFNHRLRGAESDADQRFVEDLAASLGLPVVIGTAAGDLTSAAGGIGLEAAARRARYDFFTSAAAQHGARYVATAHTADDQAETVLLNVLRGTGLAGLAGIPRIRRLSDASTIVRPLLDVTRDEVLAYLKQLGQAFREDTTNELRDFMRNRVRNELLPLLERDFNPNVRQSLLRLAQVAGQTNELLESKAQELVRLAVRHVPGGVEVDLSNFVGMHAALVRQALFIVWREQQWPMQDMSLEKWEQVRELVLAANPKPAVLPGRIHADVQDGTLRLTRRSE